VKGRIATNGLKDTAKGKLQFSTLTKSSKSTSLRRSSRIQNKKSSGDGCQEFPACSNKPTGNKNESCETLFLIPTDHLILNGALNKNPKVLDMIKIGCDVSIWVHPTYHVAHVLGDNYVRAKEGILDVIKGLKTNVKTNFQTNQLL